ncbi:DUF4037 domain-containing protein [Rhizobium sullae]|uniref:DUF4037 domain-containing protein n=1 Tax=Rhizobium sullae TaxID=50338 RepID=UPI003CCB53CD
MPFGDEFWPTEFRIYMVRSDRMGVNRYARRRRTVEAGDTRGSVLIGARIVRSLMELSFLQERRYWPYTNDSDGPWTACCRSRPWSATRRNLSSSGRRNAHRGALRCPVHAL